MINECKKSVLAVGLEQKKPLLQEAAFITLNIKTK